MFVRRAATLMLHFGRSRELAYIIYVLWEGGGLVQPRAVHAHTEYIKSLPLTLRPLQSLLMSPAVLQIGNETDPGQVFCRVESGSHSHVYEYRRNLQA